MLKFVKCCNIVTYKNMASSVTAKHLPAKHLPAKHLTAKHLPAKHLTAMVVPVKISLQ